MSTLVFQANSGGQINVIGADTASTFNITVPAITGTMITSGDTGTVTNTMLASNVYTAPGTIGSGTPNTGAFTTLSASSTVSGTGFSTYLASPPAIGGTAAAAGSFTTLTTSSTVTLNGGTANGVAYLNGSKVLTTGTALTFDGTNLSLLPSGYSVFGASSAEQMRLTSTGLGIGTSSPAVKLDVQGASNSSTNWVWAGGNVANPPAGCTYGVLLGRNLSNGFSESNIVWGQGISSSQFLGIGKWTGSAYTEQMRLDSAGNLGLGVTPSTYAGLTAGRFEFGAAGNSVFSNTSGNAFYSQNTNYNSGYKYATTAAAGLYLQSVGQHIWYNAPSGTAGNVITFTQAMTLDTSGNLLLGQTARGHVNSTSFDLDITNGYEYINHVSGTASSTSYLSFGYNAASIGSITQSGTTAVLYNVTSDQRLKENIVDAPEFGIVIDSLKVRSFDWKTDHTHQRAGFIAQELVTVAPEAVHQPANEEEMMAVDYSKLVPMLVKEIQSLRKRLADAGIA